MNLKQTQLDHLFNENVLLECATELRAVHIYLRKMTKQKHKYNILVLDKKSK